MPEDCGSTEPLGSGDFSSHMCDRLPASAVAHRERRSWTAGALAEGSWIEAWQVVWYLQAGELWAVYRIRRTKPWNESLCRGAHEPETNCGEALHACT